MALRKQRPIVERKVIPQRIEEQKTKCGRLHRKCSKRSWILDDELYLLFQIRRYMVIIVSIHQMYRIVIQMSNIQRK